MERRALGKGIGALIPEVESTGKQDLIAHLKLEQVKPNPYQPREDFDQQSLEELMQSIKENGIIQPIVVRRQGDHYELIAGERRFRAANLLNLKEIPAIIKEVDDLGSLELSLIENIQRQDLNPIEEARAYLYLIEKFSVTQEKLSEALGKSRVFVTSLLRLLKLPQEIQEEIRKGRISYGHGRVLLETEDLNRQRKLAHEVISKGLSVRELENLLRSRRQVGVRRQHREHPGVDTHIAVFQDELQQILATKVRISKRKKRGSITIEFYSQEDLKRIIARIRGGSA